MKPSDITIDKDFEQLIRPLSADERKELKESLSSCGLLSPLIVWKHEGKTILVDGHNRLALWKESDGFNEEFEFRTQELRFGSRDKVREWILKNQLGRRNLSPADFRLLVGMLYNSRKKSKSEAQAASVESRNSKGQNDPCKTDTTAEQVASETGVSPKSVKRAGKLAAKVEEIQAAEPETPREEVIDRAKKEVTTAKDEKPTPTLEQTLKKRWDVFIKPFPVTQHTEVRLWVTAKLKEAAL
jgi:hypothetical protein